jgi:signal transduction histidine kinase
MSEEITRHDLLELFENSFDYLLIYDGEERVRHLSPSLASFCGRETSELTGLLLADLIRAEDIEDFRQAARRVGGGEEKVTVYWKPENASRPVVFKAGSAETSAGRLYLFRSSLATDVGTLGLKSDWERVERAKELACLYSVAEWIHESTTIDEFFTHFPKYMAPGMHYPEHVMVYAVYQGQEYGECPPGERLIRSILRVGGEVAGEIIVGYDDSEIGLLPEEQRLLDEIARFLCLALERRNLANTLEVKQEEAGEYTRKLADLEQTIEARTRELVDQRSKLDRVNAYLDQVHSGFNESKRTLDTMFRAIPDMVVLLDKNYEIIMTNRDQMEPGQTCHRALFNSETPCLNCHLQRIRETHAPITAEIRKGDTYYEVHALPVFSKDQEVDGIIEFYRDITGQKVYEQQLQQADKLKSLGQLVSGVGHEINNPNQFIRGNVKIIKQALEDLLPIVDEYQAAHPELKIARLKYDFFRENIMTLVNDMANGSERIKRIVDSLKGFARKDEGRLTDRVEINNVIQESAHLVYNQVHKRAEIILDLAPNLPVFAGNAQKLEQVLINLIINAGQAIPDDQRGEIRVTSALDGNRIKLVVADNGIGMNERTMKSIFDPFFTTKRATGGSGLGLSIVFRIVEEHQGTIQVKSRVGKGTTFTLRLPHGKPQESAAPAERQEVR